MGCAASMPIEGKPVEEAAHPPEETSLSKRVGEEAVSTSNRQGCNAKLEHDTLSANTSYTSSSVVERPLSSVATSNKAKIHVEGANHHDELNKKIKISMRSYLSSLPRGRKSQTLEEKSTAQAQEARAWGESSRN
jgi:hypothetical protein